MKNMSRLLAVLADPTRLRLVRLLLRQELCVCELVDALRMPQYKVSRHLRRMRAMGLVEARRDGRWMHYKISRQATAGGFHQELLKIIGVYLRDTAEVISDDARLSRRLRLRRVGQCVVGGRGVCAANGKTRSAAGQVARRAASRRRPSRAAHPRATG
jgi:ArsR family transcriptional regulator